MAIRSVSADPAGITEEAPWPSLKRWSFRFAFCYIVLYYSPAMLRIFGLGIIADWVYRLWNHILGASIGISIPPPRITGSGDTLDAYILQALVLGLTLIASVTWSLLGRKRKTYPALHGWLRVFARYSLAFALFGYGVSKILVLQFPPLQDAQLSQTYGQSSPMGLLWRFMGYSAAYNVFTGFAEVLPAVLLLFRRTALLGSLLAFAVMLNVVMLNFCYDVPVKLYSLNLLLLSLFLVLPEIGRLRCLFLLNAPVHPTPHCTPIFSDPSVNRKALWLKGVILTLLFGWSIFSAATRYSKANVRVQSHPTPLTTRGFHWVQDYPYNR